MHSPFRLTVTFLAIHSILAGIFILRVNRPVFDDDNNLPDVRRYVFEGFSADAIERHINPTGPGSFLWMACAGRIFGDKLWAYRSAVLASWLLTGIGVLILGRSAGSNSVLAAALVPLTFLHSATASATVLTEGPALLFATLGGLVWIHAVFHKKLSWASAGVALIAGFSIGLAVVCRQYYLTLLPVMCMTALIFGARSGRKKAIWWLSVLLSALAAAVPVLTLLSIWGGLSSPGMVTGVSYQGVISTVGLNPYRPLVAFFYVALYLLPSTFPCVRGMSAVQHIFSAIVALLIGALFCWQGLEIVQWGPLRSLAQAAGRIWAGDRMVLAVVAGTAAYNFCGLSVTASRQWKHWSANPYAVFSCLAIAFFVLEQVGVAGNIPFYERYVLQMAPFIGVLAYTIIPGLDSARFIVANATFASSQLLLWRYAL